MPTNKSGEAQSGSSSRSRSVGARSRAVHARPAKKALPLGQTLRLEALAGLAAELTMLRQHPPVVQHSPGRYEGDILGFVRGLRLSAKVLYFLRDHVADAGFQVCWGHLLSANEESCSPECDIIIHNQGLIRKWNGSQDPVMNFSFVKASAARAVVSCKSLLTSVDAKYPKDLKKHGVQYVFLFAETCKASQLEKLREKARLAGYAGLCCLYTTEPDSPLIKTNEMMWIEFGEALVTASKKARDKADAAELKNQSRSQPRGVAPKQRIPSTRR